MKDHVIVVGLGFGDEGKGATVDAFTTKAIADGHPFDLVVRFNGGQQAEHSVINKGRHHKFNQFGSGFFNGVPSHTSRFCSFDPLTFNREAAGLSKFTTVDPYTLHTVSPQAKLTTPLHILANHELEAQNGHGTVGVGFGETIRYSLAHDNYLTVSDMKDKGRLTFKLWNLYGWYLDQGLLEEGILIEDIVEDIFKYGSYVNLMEDEEALNGKRLIFEGAQGVLLDEYWGFHPHTTWSRTTQHNADLLLQGQPRVVVGVTRTYHTRHGAGPLQSEGLFPDAPEELHNGDSGIQGSFRKAGFSLPLFEYALDRVNPDYLSVTHTDVNPPAFYGSSILQLPAQADVEEADHHAVTHVAGKVSVTDNLRPSGLNALSLIRLRGDVILTSDGPNDTDRTWM